MTGLDRDLWLAVACSVAAFVLLAYRVTRGIAPWFDAPARLLFGRMTTLAALLTISGYARTLAVVGAVAVLLALVRHTLLPVTIVILVQVVSQLAVIGIKGYVKRSRPTKWLFRQERGTSYPSGHATTAIVFYGAWLILVAESSGPAGLKGGIIAVLAVWIAGICWSRVALGAHYPSDVLGGALVGAAFLSAEFTLLDRFHIP